MAAAFDEMTGSDGTLRPAYGELSRWLSEVPPDVLDYRRREAEVLFRRIGITFAVYGEADAQERLIPFDVLPRILAAAEWDILRAGLEQRVKAINHYLRDVYTRRDILKAGVVPEDFKEIEGYDNIDRGRLGLTITNRPISWLNHRFTLGGDFTNNASSDFFPRGSNINFGFPQGIKFVAEDGSSFITADYSATGTARLG